MRKCVHCGSTENLKNIFTKDICGKCITLIISKYTNGGKLND